MLHFRKSRLGALSVALTIIAVSAEAQPASQQRRYVNDNQQVVSAQDANQGYYYQQPQQQYYNSYQAVPVQPAPMQDAYGNYYYNNSPQYTDGNYAPSGIIRNNQYYDNRNAVNDNYQNPHPQNLTEKEDNNSSTLDWYFYY